MNLDKAMLGDIVINIVNIIVLFLVTKKLLYKPLKKYLDSRKEKLSASQAEAELKASEAKEAKEKYDELCSQAESEKNKILSDAKKEAEAQAEEIVSGAEAQARSILSQADADAKKKQEKAVEDAKDDICDAAVAIAGKILARECTDADNKAVIDSFFSAQEV